MLRWYQNRSGFGHVGVPVCPEAPTGVSRRSKANAPPRLSSMTRILTLATSSASLSVVHLRGTHMHGTTKDRSTVPLPPTRQRKGRGIARASFHLHLWLGVLSTGVLILVAITGILLNHKRALGLMPDVPHEASGAFENALPLATLAERAAAAVGPAIAGRGIDRMDVRPGDGLIKIRYDDRSVTEATVDV